MVTVQQFLCEIHVDPLIVTNVHSTTIPMALMGKLNTLSNTSTLKAACATP